MSNTFTYKFLTKNEVVDGDNEVLYFTFTLPDTTSWSNFNSQAKPFLDELKAVMPLINDQAKELHNKILKNLSDDARVIDDLKSQLEECKQELNMVQSQVATNVSTDAQSLIDDLTKKADELKNQRDLAITAEGELQDQVSNLKDMIKDLETTAEQNTEAMELLNDKMDTLKKQLSEARKQPASENQSAIKSKLALLKALKNAETIIDSPAKKPSTTIVLDGEEETGKKSSNIKLKINTSLPTFAGLPNQNIGEFIHGADRVFEFGEYSDSEKVNAASSYLKGIAFSDWLLHEQENGKQTWKQFCDYMRAKYTPYNHSQVIRSRIRILKQIGSVRDYYVDFRTLCVQAPEMNVDEKLDHFINNLKPEYSKFVKTKECKTLEAAFNAALLHETINAPELHTTSSFMATSYQNSNQQHNNRNSKSYARFNQNQNSGFKIDLLLLCDDVDVTSFDFDDGVAPMTAATCCACNANLPLKYGDMTVLAAAAAVGICGGGSNIFVCIGWGGGGGGG